jgi:outer membrane protein OmpA-like peptidoglycan-associated protein
MTISQIAAFKEIHTARTTSCERKIVLSIIIIFTFLFVSISLQAQDHFRKNNTRYYKAKFKKQTVQYANACSLLERKRKQKPRSSAFAFLSKSKQYQKGGETGRVLSNPNPKSKSIPNKPASTQPIVTAKATEIPSPEKLEVLHHKEDEVLAENKLPKPTSEKHEQIRKQVQEHLKSKKDNEPIELAPLYFTFAEDEFSVVDMDPFLVAVEYALQGRIILIEGHTDNKGDANYNNQLSIKRVQKIRQLMIDMGVSDDHISIVGYGEGAPKHENSSEASRQLNRRVDFKAF